MPEMLRLFDWSVEIQIYDAFCCQPLLSIIFHLKWFKQFPPLQATDSNGGKAKCGVILEPTTQSKMFRTPDDIILSPGSAQLRLRLNVDSKSDILFQSKLPRLSSVPMCGELRQTVESIWSDRVIWRHHGLLYAAPVPGLVAGGGTEWVEADGESGGGGGGHIYSLHSTFYILHRHQGHSLQLQH